MFAPPIHKIAEAMGVTGHEVRALKQFGQALEAATDMQLFNQTTLIEVHCSPEMRCPTRYHPKYAHLTTTEANFNRQFIPK